MSRVRWKLSRTVLRGASGGNIVRLLDQKTSEGAKQPYYFYVMGKPIFGFAALWEMWQDETGKELETCTIITTRANEALKPVHDRMPVILQTQDYDEWLDEKATNTEKLQQLLKPYPAKEMGSYQVSSDVNIPDVDSPKLIENLNSK